MTGDERRRSVPEPEETPTIPTNPPMTETVPDDDSGDDDSGDDSEDDGDNGSD